MVTFNLKYELILVRLLVYICDVSDAADVSFNRFWFHQLHVLIIFFNFI